MALCGYGSRRKNKDLILGGKVLINNSVVTDLSHKVDPEKDIVIVEGKVAKLPPKVYYLFYKPKGFLTSLYDPHHRKTIKIFLDKLPYRVFPVGRLDKESEGLLLLTNDGDLANILLHPKYEIKRTYLVWVAPKIDEKRLNHLLEEGIEIENKKIRPLEFKLFKREREFWVYSVTVKEGVKREVRKMVNFLGGRVYRLLRVAFGPLKLSHLKPGEIRPLNNRELKALMELVYFKNSKILETTSSGERT